VKTSNFEARIEIKRILEWLANQFYHIWLIWLLWHRRTIRVVRFDHALNAWHKRGLPCFLIVWVCATGWWSTASTSRIREWKSFGNIHT